MCEEQTKLNADSHKSRLFKESVSPALVPAGKNEAITLSTFRPGKSPICAPHIADLFHWSHHL